MPQAIENEESSSTSAVAAANVAPPILAPLPLPSADFHRWMSCFAVITFDLSVGPSLECVYPPNQLTDSEITNGQRGQISRSPTHADSAVSQ